MMNNIVRRVPLGRPFAPRQIARCVVLLKSEDAGFRAGATPAVNDAFSMY